jgi:hypothetical protein
MSVPPPDAQGARSATPGADLRRWLPLMGLAVGVWALLPKYVTPPLNTSDRAEFADHVIPGIVILGASAAALLWQNRQRLSLVPLMAGMAVVLAGFWMVATHLPLLFQAFRGDAPWAGTIHHTASALAVFGLGLLWCATHWSDLAALEAAETKASPEAK